MANLARMAFKDTQAGLRPREAKVITTCSSAWWADRAKIGLPSNASPALLSGRPRPSRTTAHGSSATTRDTRKARAAALTIARGPSVRSRSPAFVDGGENVNDGLVAGAAEAC